MLGSVAGLEIALRRLINITSDVAMLCSTMLIAALFHPLRRRIQKIINRRFYRQNYRAARVMAAFSATMRDEIDLQHLNALLLATVEETMQPAFISLWRSERPPATTSIGSNEHHEEHGEALC